MVSFLSINKESMIGIVPKYKSICIRLKKGISLAKMFLKKLKFVENNLGYNSLFDAKKFRQRYLSIAKCKKSVALNLINPCK